MADADRTKCRKHPWYRGVYRHRTDCEECDTIYLMAKRDPAVDRMVEAFTQSPEPVRSRWERLKTALKEALYLGS